MTPREIYENIRDYLDSQVSSLSPEDYLSVLGELEAEISARIEITEQEIISPT